jgi:hypothetical protein
MALTPARRKLVNPQPAVRLVQRTLIALALLRSRQHEPAAACWTGVDRPVRQETLAASQAADPDRVFRVHDWTAAHARET